ncbi:MAG: Dabb family protein [Oceanipulchritudo sp.]
MITHIVFFKMLPEAEGRSDRENADKLVELLQNLPREIEPIVELEAGTDFSATPASFDVGLVTRFRTREDLETYRVHEAHQAVVQFVGRTTSERAVVDYESG